MITDHLLLDVDRTSCLPMGGEGQKLIPAHIHGSRCLPVNKWSLYDFKISTFENSLTVRRSGHQQQQTSQIESTKSNWKHVLEDKKTRFRDVLWCVTFGIEIKIHFYKEQNNNIEHNTVVWWHNTVVGLFGKIFLLILCSLQAIFDKWSTYIMKPFLLFR